MTSRSPVAQPRHAMRVAASRCSAFLATTLLASCVAAPPPRPAAAIPPPPPSVAETSAGVMAAHLQSTAATLDAYKRDVARHIYRSNPQARFEGAPPPLLRSVVVLAIRVDANGNPVRVAVVRSNGYHDLEQAAIHSVQAAAPLPMPSRAVARGQPTEYFETWLFRDDGLYQIRSLAEVQASSED